MSPKKKGIIGAIFFLVLSVVYGGYALNIQLFVTPGRAVFTAQSLPAALSLMGILCSLLYIISIILGKKITERIQDHPEAGTPQAGTPQDTVAAAPPKNWQAVFFFFIMMIIYAVIIRFVGFIIATMLFLFAGAYLLGERRMHVNAIVSIGTVLGFWLIIGKLMNIYLAEGSLWEALF